MTVLTRCRGRSSFVRFLVLPVLIGVLTLVSAGQKIKDYSIGSEGDHGAVSSALTLPTTLREDSCLAGVSDIEQQLLNRQPETERKLHPAIRVTAESDPAGDETKQAGEAGPEPKFEPFLPPLDRIPQKSRFFTEDDPKPNVDELNGVSEKFHWKPAILQSMVIQGFQLGYALTVQEKTRRALKGPFFDDYWESIKGVRGWDDGNKFFTNYIAHPMQGGMTGFIFVQNHDRAKKQKFGESKQYWKDRFKAFVWSAAWSTNWELGPISQSSVGNVGLYGKQGYVDLVITPTVGTGWLLTEEALDRYVIRHIEAKGRMVKMVARTFMNPMRSVANLLRFKEPWYRDRPFGH